jgi:bifunctional NMN adenylyltransferase/nudix hydrolase
MHRRGISNIEYLPVNDHPYNDDQWLLEVQAAVASVTKTQAPPTLFGHLKEGNDYLKWFPQWKFRDVEAFGTYNGTAQREEMFMGRHPSVPPTVQADWDYFQKEKSLFANYPFPETLNFNCADAVVICAGHVLLIRRKFAPGAGSWALPGGFKNQNESFFDCAVRELFEETNLRVPEKIVRKSVTKSQLFDSPQRGCGIPRNTYAYMFEVSPDHPGNFGSLPRANGADDADDVRWVPLSLALNDYNLYDDHGSIVSALTGVSPTFAFQVRN